MKENVLLFIKPFKTTDTEDGNPLSVKILEFLFKKGCSINRVKIVNLTPEILIQHYDELMREGRQNIVYSMVGDYVDVAIAEKLKNGGVLTEEEKHTSGKTVFVFDMALPTAIKYESMEMVGNKAVKKEYKVDGTIENFRKYIVGPTKILTNDNDIIEKLQKDNGDKYKGEGANSLFVDVENFKLIQENSVRAIFMNLGPDKSTSLNVVHCSANRSDRDIEINNFFKLWANIGENLDAQVLNCEYNNRKDYEADITTNLDAMTLVENNAVETFLDVYESCSKYLN